MRKLRHRDQTTFPKKYSKWWSYNLNPRSLVIKIHNLKKVKKKKKSPQS